MNPAPEVEADIAAEPPVVYAVPRRLDLMMLLSITLGYALLFTVMRALRSDAIVFVLTAGLFTVVGIGQAVLFGGKSPRAASVLVGALYFGALAVVGGRIPWPVGFLVLGGFCGYLAGLLDAGVFLVLDLVRRRVTPSSEAADAVDQQAEP